MLLTTGIISGFFSITAGNQPLFSITAKALLSFSLTAGGITFSVGTISHHFNLIVAGNLSHITAGRRSQVTAGRFAPSITSKSDGSVFTTSVVHLGTISHPLGAVSTLSLKTTEPSSLTIFSTFQLYTSFNALYDASAFSVFPTQNSIALQDSRIRCSASSTSILDNSLLLSPSS